MTEEREFIRIFRDGGCMCALIGADPVEGEAEFFAIDPPGNFDQVRLAGAMAALALEERLGFSNRGVEWYFDEDTRWFEPLEVVDREAGPPHFLPGRQKPFFG